MALEDWELSKGQKLQHTTEEYLDAGLPRGSALLPEPLDFEVQQCLLHY